MLHRTHLLEPALAGLHASVLGGAGPAPNGPRRLALCVGADLAAPGVRPELAQHGWRCHHVADVDQAARAVAAIGFDALLLSDAALAGDFVPRLTALRRSFAGPLLVLATRGEEIDEILALELGADDYLHPPFNAHRLRARLSAALRAPSAKSPSPAAALEHARPNPGGGWSVDVRQALLRGQGRVFRLSASQAAVMALLLERGGEAVTRAEVALHAGMSAQAARGRAVDMCLHHLRRRLAQAGVTWLSIETVRGIGYALHTVDAEAAPPRWSRSGAPAARLVAVA
jgi:DNA-binding response OmpR family regulator